ncbi:MAG: sugar phosphate isomerase/epimerase family protein [Imperialibacter sp.]|uniref:sugar phosphate isomerase/epimerase family protein n=1 Tax=Imperialibacter sp. TaxID=2038411 RepID=UPI0032ED60A9
MTKTTNSSRRSFLQKAGLASLTLPLGGYQLLKAAPLPARQPQEKLSVLQPFRTVGKHKIGIFSKALQWTDLNQMADMVAESGFDGVDLTVRPGGHVEPERAKDDLPKYAEAMKKVGKEIVMITTAIDDADAPYTVEILETASKLGLGYYRMGWYKYDAQKSVADNLSFYAEKMKSLAELNKAYRIWGGYQNIAGANVGSPLWDLVQILQQVNSPWLGSQYDIRHAFVEGANSWPLGFDQLRPDIKTTVLKDFYWGKANGKWEIVNVPMGEGMVDFKNYFDKMKVLAPDIPISVHQEYDLGGAELGQVKANITEAQLIAAMKKDFEFIKKNLV